MVAEKSKLFNLGVDIGGTKIAIGMVAQGEILAQETYPTEAGSGPDAVIKKLAVKIESFVTAQGLTLKEINSIGLGVPGTVDLNTGLVILAPNIYWQNVPLVKKLQTFFPGIAIYAGQDTSVTAWGEFLACDLPQVENLYFLTVSTGVGSGLVINKRLYRGTYNTAGEIGHVVVEKNGHQCTCGNQGCLQEYTKGPAIAREAELRIKNGRCSVLSSILESEGRLTAANVAEAALKGDVMAGEVMQQAAEYIGRALAEVISLFAPDLIVIGGGVAQCGDLFVKPVTEVALACCYPPARKGVQIRLTKLWEKAGIIGASLLYTTLGNNK